MRTIGTVFSTVVFLFFLTLIGRLVFDWVQVLSRDWRPKGAVLVVAEPSTRSPTRRCARCAR